MKRFGNNNVCLNNKNENVNSIHAQACQELIKKIEELQNQNSFLSSKLETTEIQQGLSNFSGSITQKKLEAEVLMLEGINKALQERVNMLEEDSETLIKNSTTYHTQNKLYEEKLKEMRCDMEKLEKEHFEMKLAYLNAKNSRTNANKDSETKVINTSKTDSEKIVLQTQIELKEKQIEELEAVNTHSIHAQACQDTVKFSKQNETNVSKKKASNKPLTHTERVSWKK